MCKTKHFFDHTGLFHKGLNRALTEHELDATIIPADWHKAFTNEIHLCTGKWLVADAGFRTWDGDRYPPGVTEEEVIARNQGVVSTFGYRKAR
jgi:hypothetical protein